MPSPGDLRNRLSAPADAIITGHPKVCRLFTCRLPTSLENRQLLALLDSMIAGKAALVAAIPGPVRGLIHNQLGFFRDAMPPGFDLRGASIATWSWQGATWIIAGAWIRLFPCARSW